MKNAPAQRIPARAPFGSALIFFLVAAWSYKSPDFSGSPDAVALNLVGVAIYAGLGVCSIGFGIHMLRNPEKEYRMASPITLVFIALTILTMAGVALYICYTPA